MARVGGSYESVVRGVSEQAPQDRRSGQMWEQVNMISDPVRGLSRRHGSQYMNSTLLPIMATNTELMIDSEQMKVKEFSVNAKDYDLIYSKNKLDKLAPLYVYGKDDNLWLPVEGHGPIWSAILANGVASMTNIGRFMYIAARGYQPTFDTVNEVEADDAAKNITIWIRNGDYARKYSFQYTLVDGRQFTATVETPTSSYPGALDTSWIPVPGIDMGGNPNADEISRRLAVFNQQMANYNKQVADVTNNYNSAVTQWIGTASAAIQPPAIALKLAQAIIAQVGGAGIQADNQYIMMNQNMLIKSGSVIDGGDGTYMRAVVLSTDDPTNLTPICWYNKVVKVKPKSAGGKDTYYVRAEAKNTGDGRGWGEVTWREYTGVKTVPKTAFGIATIVNDKFILTSSPEEMDTVLGVTDTPKFQASSVGDQISSPVPAFLRKPINYLGTFQDRLLVGTGSTIFASRPGDYLNWFRQSVLSVADNDPVEMYALGSEDDIIYWDTSFDRNHIMFGRKYQYLIPGRALLTPKNPTIQIMSRIEDAIEAEPQASGNFVFYAKDTTAKGSLHQIQIGATSDSSESYECSQQLDKYIAGKPTQIMCMTAPFNILMRTRGYQNGFYVYTYLDSMQGGERLFDGWSRWEWDERLGSCVGVNKHQGDVLCYTVRKGAGDDVWLVADKFSFETDIPDVPQLDSWRSATVWDTAPLWWHAGLVECSAIAYRNTHEYYLLGSPLKGVDNNIPEWRDDLAHLTVGVQFPAYVIPTSPYLRDKNDKAIINGRLTLGSLSVAVSNTGGMEGNITTADRTTKMASFDGRILSRQGNRVGRAPVNDTTIMIPIYKEIREFKMTLSALTWLPLTITGMEWVGQWFSNVRRV